MKVHILKSAFLLFFSFSILNAQVTTGHIFAEVIDEVTSISVFSPKILVDAKTNLTVIPTTFVINDSKNTTFYVSTTNNNAIIYNNDPQKVNVNTIIPTELIKSSRYSTALNVNFIYN